MKTGLDKLTEAGASVAELSEELVVKERDLAKASKTAEQVELKCDGVMLLFGNFTFSSRTRKLPDNNITTVYLPYSCSCCQSPTV